MRKACASRDRWSPAKCREKPIILSPTAAAIAAIAFDAPAAAVDGNVERVVARLFAIEEELPAANPTVRLIKGARIKFAPGQPTGLHRHPVSTVGVVTAGSFNLQLEGKPVQLLKTGDSFFEPAGHTILKFDNASTNAVIGTLLHTPSLRAIRAVGSI